MITGTQRRGCGVKDSRGVGVGVGVIVGVGVGVNRSSATLGDGLAEACQRSASSYDEGAANGTTGLAGHKVRALVRGEAPFSASVSARSADNGPGIHMAKIAIVA